MHTPAVRVLIFIVTYAIVCTAPWWLSAVLLLGLLTYYGFYPEALYFGFLFDNLYGQGHEGLFITTALLCLTMFVKTRIRT